MPRKRAPRLDELGEAGIRTYRLLTWALMKLNEENGGGGEPSDEVAEIMRWLATNRKSASGTPPGTLESLGMWMTAPEAALLLGVSARQVRRWAASGRYFSGRRKIGRDWALPQREVESLRRTRAAA